MEARSHSPDERLGITTYASDAERSNRSEMLDLLRAAPIPDDQLLSNLGLFLESKNLARILFMDFLFRQIVSVHGAVMEFGTRWGQNVALFAALRGIYDPFNRHRKIIGFDTFEGFPEITPQDGASSIMQEGNLAVPEDYESFLGSVLEHHEQLNPLAHLRKFELRAGDATLELPKYLEEAPETIVALAYFDLDLYEPTRKCLEIIRPRLVRGSVLGFDELNDPDSPGETLALIEVFGLEHVRLRRLPQVSRAAYFVVE